MPEPATEPPVAVIGAGAWGTALANAAAAAGREVVLWARDPAFAAALEARRENSRYLPGVPLDARVRVTAAIAEVGAAQAALVVTPAQALTATLAAFGRALPAAMPLILCAKGIERGTGRFLTEAVEELRPGGTVAVLSGPSFAADVARGLPTAVTLAAADPALAERLARLLSGPTFRVYHTSDRRGVEIGGAAKNVLAIACGIVHGRGLGESARAALTARGFAELVRFARACGASPETLMGLSGLGDLVLTCHSTQSRNFSYGAALGRGASPAEADGGKLVEGAATAASLVQLAGQHGVEMPIARAVAEVVAGSLSVERAIEALMARPLRAEAG